MSSLILTLKMAAYSTSEVTEALKNTPKGQLPYTSPLDKLKTKEKRLEYIKSLSSPPELSPLIVLDYLTRHAPPVLSSSRPPSSLSSDSDHFEEDYATTPIGSPPLVIFCNDDSILSDCEYKELETSIQKHVDKYSKIKHEIQQVHDVRTTQIHQETEAKRHEHRLERLQEENLIMREVEKEMEIYQMSYQQHSEAVKDRIEKNKEIMRQRVAEIQRERKELFMKLQKDVLVLKDSVTRIIETCQYPQLVVDDGTIQSFNVLSNEVMAVIMREKVSTDPNPELLDKTKLMVTQLILLVTKIKELINNANNKGNELIKKQKEEEEEAAKRLQETAATLQQTTTNTTHTVNTTTNTTVNTTSTTTSTSTSNTTVKASTELPPAFQAYEELNKKLIEATKLSSDFTSNQQLKKYRYSLQSAVAYMVGSISADNGGRLVSLVRQVQQLLGGQTVEVLEKRVSINEHPLARNFCLLLLVKKMIDRVTEAPRNVFPVAGVVVLLWKELVEFGELFLAYCYQRCPLLIPITSKKTSDISDTDYKRMLGYRVSDNGTVESEDQFTDRMTPCIKLYGAIIQTDIVSPHPHGLNKGWTLLARILNNDPLGNITTIVIYNILEVAGHALLRKYKGQFKKMLHLLYKDYMNKIKVVSTPLDISKLETFFEEFLKDRQIKEPNGFLSHQFWNEGEKFSYVVD